MKTLDKILDHLALIEHGDGFEAPSETISRSKDLAKDWEGSFLDLFTVADFLEQTGKTIKDEVKDLAYTEATMQGHEEKFEYKGVKLTPFEGYAKYDYPDDEVLDKYAKQLKVVKEKMEPFKKEEKSIKDSIKSRQKRLQTEGKAKLKSITQGIRVDRK